jgi:pyrroline-5-carboxylate reductase
MPAATIGFLGAGQMAQALAAGFVRAGLANPSRSSLSIPFPQRENAS